MNIPEDLRYTSDHEWVRRDGARMTVGITDFAQSALGDIVFVERPIHAQAVTASESCGEIESTKSVSDLYAPLSGRVVDTNAALDEHPEIVNSDPYGDGWICVIEAADESAYDALLAPEAYALLVAQEESS